MVVGLILKGASKLAKKVAASRKKSLNKGKAVIKAKRKEANKAVQKRKKAAERKQFNKDSKILDKKIARANAADTNPTRAANRAKLKKKLDRQFENEQMKQTLFTRKKVRELSNQPKKPTSKLKASRKAVKPQAPRLKGQTKKKGDPTKADRIAKIKKDVSRPKKKAADIGVKSQKEFNRAKIGGRVDPVRIPRFRNQGKPPAPKRTRRK